MKFFRSFLFLFIAALVITSCQKELSAESGTAKGSLVKDSSGDCSPILVNGSYVKNVLLTTNNYVEVQVNITQVGTYAFKTAVLNGYSFSATGLVTVAGLTTIRLFASGTPIAASLDIFDITFAASTCKINVIVTASGAGSNTAVFSLVGSPSTCTGAVQTTNFYATIPTSNDNYVDVKVDVTTAGTYTITTPVVNGVSFSSTGSLVVGTNQSIRLLANGGTPTAAGSFNYALSTTTPASNCGFALTVQAAPMPAQYTFDCPSSPIFFGTYEAGVSTTGNTVDIDVTSVAGGSYTITTSTTSMANSNGVTFTGSGVLAPSTSSQSVTLTASGTPMAGGKFTYTLTGSGVTSTCTFDQTYSAAPPVSTDSIVASIDGVYKTFKIRDSAIMDKTVAGYTGVSIIGYGTPLNNDGMGLFVYKQGTSVTPGTYTVNQWPASYVSGQYVNSTDTYIGVSDRGTPSTPPTTQTPGFTINITSITATRVIGTFSGRIFEKKGAGPGYKTVTGGIFSVTVYP